MSRAGTVQVTLDSSAQFALESLATAENRSLSNMAATLIREALARRGVELGEAEVRWRSRGPSVAGSGPDERR